MGFFGGRRQRMLANFNNTRDVGGDGLTNASSMTPQAVLAGDFPLPGIIGGFGGGTFNMDGTQVTPPSRNMDSAPPIPISRLGILGQSRGGYATPNVDGSAMPFEGVKPSNPQKGGGFFRKGGPWIDVLGAIGDGLTGNPLYANTKLRREQMALESAKLQQSRLWDVEDRNWKASQPEYFTSGRDRIKLDPMTGKAQVVYDGPEDFDEYAQAFGLEPGTDEYEQAITDYVLRGHGPTALKYDKQLDDYRTENDKGYDAYRTQNRLKVRSSPTYRDKNPLPLRPRAAPRTTAAPPVVATNPKTGEKVMLDGRGKWVSVK